jgi:glycine cleavage system H lipoate-binding protein
MFPGVNGFKWDAGHVIFLGAFYAVVFVVLATVVRALVRSRRHFRFERADTIRWRQDFRDLPARDRRCRHELNGEVDSRVCENGFDCRGCAKHPEFERAAAAQAALPRGDLFGFPMPLDRLYHRGHTWVRKEKDGTLAVGLDELGARLIGKPERLALPQVGRRVHTNGTGWRVTRNGSTVRVLAPIDGTVVATGGPEQGWYLKLRPDTPAPDTRHLLRDGEAVRWMSGELDRLQLLAMHGACPALADGGAPVADIGDVLPKNEWGAVCGEMLLEP